MNINVNVECSYKGGKALFQDCLAQAYPPPMATGGSVGDEWCNGKPHLVLGRKESKRGSVRNSESCVLPSREAVSRLGSQRSDFVRGLRSALQLLHRSRSWVEMRGVMPDKGERQPSPSARVDGLARRLGRGARRLLSAPVPRLSSIVHSGALQHQRIKPVRIRSANPSDSAQQ
jgi:hypothetical protein